MEFSNLQPASKDSHLQAQIPINSAAKLIELFESRSNAGDQVEMFLAVAEGEPEIALTSFSTIIRNRTDQTTKALGIQAFGRISQPYKQALSRCTSQESQELLKLLCNEIRGRSSDLVVWAAAEALREIGFSLDYVQHPQGGNLSEPPRRIQREILDRKIQEINRIQRLNSRGKFTAEYERFLEFWVYGPTFEFFSENSTNANYIKILKDILDFTQVRGVQLGLIADNATVQEESFFKAQSIFKQYSDSKDTHFKKALGDSLKRFLKEEKTEDSHLQQLDAALIFNHYLTIKNKESQFSRLTIAEMEGEISSLEKYKNSIKLIFQDAYQVLDELTLLRLLENNEKTYLVETKNWIEKLNNQIQLVKSEKNKIKENSNLLESSFNSISKIDHELFSGIVKDLSREYQSLVGQTPQTEQDCQSLQSNLRKIKDQLLTEIRGRITSLSKIISDLKTSFDFKQVQENATGWITSGIVIVSIVFICSSIFASCSVSNYSNNRQETPWYATGYPKNQCGSSSSSNNCWYPVFVPYTKSNWSQSVNLCRDVPKAQRQSKARRQKQIKIAAFNNEGDAQGFINFIDNNFEGTPWIGQRKCY